VKTSSSLGLCAGASALIHAALAWQLYLAPGAPSQPRERDTFRVRMVTLPAPEPEPRVSPQPSKPRPKPAAVKPRPEPAPAVAEPLRPARAEPEPEPASAPGALLAESGTAPGGVVLAPSAPIAAWVTQASLPASLPARGPAVPVARLAKLSDLSRKPRAPSLDAALRDNYPAALRRRGTEGQAEVRVVIDPRGRVGQIEIISESAAGFAEACRRTLLGSRWSEPLDQRGNPVSTRLKYRCRFQIER
jgi:protein TonB